MPVDDDLLKQFKTSIGDFNDDFVQDDYYKNFLSQAIADLITDDISESQLNTDIGRATTVLYAEALMNKTDIATNPTISLLRNKLSLLTKGERYITTKGCICIQPNDKY